MLSVPCLSVCLSCLSVCNVGVLWPNGWTDQDETWRAGRPRSWPHCVRWGHSSPLSGGAGSPSNTMWPGPGPRPTSMPSFISIHPTVWPQYINVRDRTDRQDRQRSDGLGRTILQMVAQKPTWQMADARTLENGVVMGDAVIPQ